MSLPKGAAIDIYTDGAAEPSNPGPAGSAFVVVLNGVDRRGQHSALRRRLGGMEHAIHRSIYRRAVDVRGLPRDRLRLASYWRRGQAGGGDRHDD